VWKLTGGLLVGWGLGSNDAANIFGTGVAANAIRYRTAIVLISIFVVVGALLEGHKSMDTVGDMSRLSHMAAFVAALAAGVTVSAYSFLSLPVSTSQAIMGAVLGIGMISGVPDFTRLYKVVVCWVLTPVCGIAFSYILYPLLGKIFQRFLIDLQLRNMFIRWGLIFAGCYGAYSLGANNVANVTGVYVGSGLLTPFHAALIGSLSIACGVLTYSKKVLNIFCGNYAPFIYAGGCSRIHFPGHSGRRDRRGSCERAKSRKENDAHRNRHWMGFHTTTLCGDCLCDDEDLSCFLGPFAMLFMQH
jgi:PiT family inorganic phosphate transporter